MRILYHHRTLADGAEGIHIAAMVDAFRHLGHEVRIPHPPGTGVSHRRRRLVEAVRALMPQMFFEAAAVIYNAVDYLRFRRQIGSFHPDLVYARHSRLDLAALAAAAHAGVPTLLEVNTLYSTPRYEQFDPLSLRRVAKALERKALRYATRVFAVSSPLAADVRALAGVDCLVVPNGADPDRFTSSRPILRDVRRQYGLDGRFVIGWTGIIRDWHGLELLLSALADVPDAVLLVVGDGPGRSGFERGARQRGVDSRVVVTGRVSHQEIADHVQAMDVAVVADERTGVASPMKLLEYMAMARPVVAPRQPNIQDLIVDGVDGLLFERGNVDELAGLLRRLAQDTGLRAALGRAARVKIERRRNWRSIAAELAALVSPKTPPSITAES